ncbi:tRNA (guanine(9)-N(1))-methyltransferase [Madurella fahalii]|uniref:tRNA (guanine(9)-N1)-methyltransferase n=1 Tax=Madurella fahalii TaxID=1157608 RepID=A0ABQ0GIF1_9PEZI
MVTEESQHTSVDIGMVDISEPVHSSGPALAGNGKRKAEAELEHAAKKKSPSDDDDQGPPANETSATHAGDTEHSTNKPLSKNQLKRLRRQQQWEEYKEDRKAKRKDKRHERQARKRAEKEAKMAEVEAAGIDPATVLQTKEPWIYRPVPVSFIIDCDFEQYMRDPEIVSLSSQIVRSYAMNRKSKYQASLHISSWKGKLKSRFETILKNTHENWKNVGIHEGDFRQAAKQAYEQMTSPHGGEVIDLIKPSENNQEVTADSSNGANTAATPAPDADDVDKSIVYLTSDSPYTLDRLEANTSYIIGGLVDRNREKGLCYKRAREYKVRTAKLPIGEYMAMQSRYVLTTNQVVEIMAKWLECGDWGKAFMDVIPKRKGGTLKNGDSEKAAKEEDGVGQDVDAAEGLLSRELAPTDCHRESPRGDEPVAPKQAVSQ